MWVPRHHDVARPEAVYEETTFQIWRLPANMLNTYVLDGGRGQPEKGGPAAWGWQGCDGVGGGGKQLFTVRAYKLRHVAQDLGPGGFLWKLIDLWVP
jgi:hypothetical protein